MFPINWESFGIFTSFNVAVFLFVMPSSRRLFQDQQRQWACEPEEEKKEKEKTISTTISTTNSRLVKSTGLISNFQSMLYSTSKRPSTFISYAVYIRTPPFTSPSAHVTRLRSNTHATSPTSWRSDHQFTRQHSGDDQTIALDEKADDSPDEPPCHDHDSFPNSMSSSRFSPFEMSTMSWSCILHAWQATKGEEDSVLSWVPEINKDLHRRVRGLQVYLTIDPLLHEIPTFFVCDGILCFRFAFCSVRRPWSFRIGSAPLVIEGDLCGFRVVLLRENMCRGGLEPILARMID